jgi:hypothetical protein
MVETSAQSSKIAKLGKPPCRDCARKNMILARMTRSSDEKPAKQLYFDEKWVAFRWGVSVKSLQKMRYSGAGPKWQRPFGRAVRYRLRDIVAFERQQEKSSSSIEH